MLAIAAEATPLELDKDGVVCVVGTRVTLDSVVGEFKDGATAEEIAQRYPVLALPDVYAVIAYYLRRTAEVDGYLAEGEAQADAARIEYAKVFNERGIRERLLNRRRDANDPSR